MEETKKQFQANKKNGKRNADKIVRETLVELNNEFEPQQGIASRDEFIIKKAIVHVGMDP